MPSPKRSTTGRQHPQARGAWFQGRKPQAAAGDAGHELADREGASYARSQRRIAAR